MKDNQTNNPTEQQAREAIEEGRKAIETDKKVSADSNNQRKDESEKKDAADWRNEG
jgi:hypothetical protein